MIAVIRPLSIILTTPTLREGMYLLGNGCWGGGGWKGRFGLMVLIGDWVGERRKCK